MTRSVLCVVRLCIVQCVCCWRVSWCGCWPVCWCWCWCVTLTLLHSTTSLPRVYIQNVSVCTGTTPASVTTCGRGAGSHGDVLNVHTWFFQRATPHRTHTPRPHRHTQTAPTHNMTRTKKTERDRERRQRKRDKTRQDKKTSEDERGETQDK